MGTFLRRKLRRGLDVLEVLILLLALPFFIVRGLVGDWLHDIRGFFGGRGGT